MTSDLLLTRRQGDFTSSIVAVTPQTAARQ
jgi:hypothetical protein